MEHDSVENHLDWDREAPGYPREDESHHHEMVDLVVEEDQLQDR